MILTLPIPAEMDKKKKNLRLEDCLENLFNQNETLNEANSWHCERCDEDVLATRSTCVFVCSSVFTYSEYSLVSLINSYTCHVSLEHTRARTQQVHRFGIFQIHSCYVWNDFKETRKIVTKNNIQRLHLQLIIQFEVLICQSFGNVNVQKSRDVEE